MRRVFAFIAFVTLITAPFFTPAIADDTTDQPLDCTDTPGGAQCAVSWEAEAALLYCVAEDSNGEPVANSTVASDDGVAVFNAVEAGSIAAIRCRVDGA